MAYSTQTDIETIYGETNVALWSNTENEDITDGVPAVVTAAITASIAYADAIINDRFRGRRYTIPFTSTPTVVLNWSATIAGVWLYRRRGMQTGSDTDETNRYAGMEANALKEMDLYLGNSRKFDLPESDTRPTAPVVVI